MTLPLSGVKVLDLSQVWAVPGAAMYLGDQGADVIKVEPLHGDEARRLSTTPFLKENAPGFLVVNRNKRGIAVDIRTSLGLEIVQKLIPETDVVLINFRPGVADRLGIGYGALRMLNPRLIYVAASPYGEVGEWANRRGYDLLFQGLSGQLGRLTMADGTPVPGGRWTVDTAGSMALAYGIALALYRREQTGEGQRVETSMLEMSLALQSVGLLRAFDDPSTEKPVTPMTHTLYRCSDGLWIIMIIVRPEDWRVLCDVLGLQHLASTEHFHQSRVDREFQREAAHVFQGVFETMDRDHWLYSLMQRDFPVAPVLNPDEAMEHAHLNANRMFVELDHPVAGRLKMFAPPIRLSEGAPQVLTPGPLLGQHTDEILTELGYSSEQIGQLRERYVVA